MNRITRFLSLLALLSACMLNAPDATGQRQPGTVTDSAVQHHRFVFYAQWVISYTGHRRQMTPPYELLVTSDSIACFLPYTGRMYRVPTPEELRFMSIRFTSRKFSYTAKRGKRSGWELTIVPADVKDIQELFFSISRKGWAMLTIRSAGRDQISYEGPLEPLR